MNWAGIKGLLHVAGRHGFAGALVAAIVLFGSPVLPGSGAVAAADSIPRSHGAKTKRIVARQTGEKPGTILISNRARTLDLVLDRNSVARYSVTVGRDGFTWAGTARVGGKAEWPDWRPPAEMRKRDPSLPEIVPAGPYNPLGARALYLFNGGRDTLYRIHGTNDSASIGDDISSGCFRMTNADVMELYRQVQLGAKVIVE
ncbi:L,D-transpeptidase [Pseudaminobacter sp. 19-2017]|uniref:L,D-transpeptidase n=1 Tax=Pseudaminobacter soli (ex Zhang et al. 2022) TaxID=2831468 RepID=A0A942DVW9_9HYPH|nr:L,D-transpeptidase [Pseudaminobacter soli]MBS3648104.1 L,D-transpeptidase [Pseudaminobacter soli]